MPEETIPRDARVDEVGYANELWNQYVDPLKCGIKSRMTDRKLERVEGDFFNGLLVTGAGNEIEVDKFLRLLETKKITRAEFLSAISAKITPAKKFLSEKQIKAISHGYKTAAAFSVKRKEGVEIKLVQALEGLAGSIKAEDAARAQAGG